MTKSGSTKKWFKTSSKKSKSNRTDTSLSTSSTAQPQYTLQPSTTSSSTRRPSPPTYTSASPSQSHSYPYPQSPDSQPHTSSTSPFTSTSSKPFTSTSPTSSPQHSKRTKAWSKTKTFLSSLGEPPTAEYDRQQAALHAKEGKVKTSGREAYGAVNYGPYGQGGPFGQGGRL